MEIKVSKKALAEANGDIQKAMQLSKSYSAIPKYIIETNYRFRELSDFQYITRGSQYATKMKSSIFTGNLENIKKLEFLDLTEKFDRKEDLDMLPPPRFTPLVHPFNYGYKQNAGISLVDDGKGGSKLVNIKLAPKTHSYVISGSGEAPTSPSPKLLETPITDLALQESIDALKKKFEERPIWLRRALEYNLPKISQSLLKQALPHVSYSFRGGPWRSSLVKFGVDPRTDPKYRMYQTRFFRNIGKDEQEELRRRRRNGPLPYEFDGKHAPIGSLFQWCDIIETQIKDLIENCPIREVCDIVDGWFVGAEYVRIIDLLKAKMIAATKGVRLSEEKIQFILSKEKEDSRVDESLQMDDEEGENEDEELEDGEVEGEDDEDEIERENADEIAGLNRDDDSEAEEFSERLRASNEALGHSEVTTVDDETKIRDLYGYVRQSSYSK